LSTLRRPLVATGNKRCAGAQEAARIADRRVPPATRSSTPGSTPRRSPSRRLVHRRGDGADGPRGGRADLRCPDAPGSGGRLPAETAAECCAASLTTRTAVATLAPTAAAARPPVAAPMAGRRT